MDLVMIHYSIFKKTYLWADEKIEKNEMDHRYIAFKKMKKKVKIL